MKSILKKIWNFIWYDDSLISWIVNVILAVILVKFVIYPGLGLFLGTTHPLVAVVSNSMAHNAQPFDEWWEKNKAWYEEQQISKEEFISFTIKNGFNRGDIMILIGAKEPKIGDIIVYRKENSPDPPIIHGVVKVTDTFVQTKGDNVPIVQGFEQKIPYTSVIGKASIRIPFLGYVKIWFVDLIFNPLFRAIK